MDARAHRVARDVPAPAAVRVMFQPVCGKRLQQPLAIGDRWRGQAEGPRGLGRRRGRPRLDEIEMVHADDVGVRQQDGALHGRCQLADVAGPR